MMKYMVDGMVYGKLHMVDALIHDSIFLIDVSLIHY
jgi:hypothetical protein